MTCSQNRIRGYVEYSLFSKYSTTAVLLTDNYGKVESRLKINDPECCGIAPGPHVRVLMCKWQRLMQ
jgi:hypothetical protein